jgi:hypothetical protein
MTYDYVRTKGFESIKHLVRRQVHPRLWTELPMATILVRQIERKTAARGTSISATLPAMVWYSQVFLALQQAVRIGFSRT